MRLSSPLSYMWRHGLSRCSRTSELLSTGVRAWPIRPGARPRKLACVLGRFIALGLSLRGTYATRGKVPGAWFLSYPT